MPSTLSRDVQRCVTLALELCSCERYSSVCTSRSCSVVASTGLTSCSNERRDAREIMASVTTTDFAERRADAIILVIKGLDLIRSDELLLLQVRDDAPELLRVERVQFLDPEEPCTGTSTSAPWRLLCTGVPVSCSQMPAANASDLQRHRHQKSSDGQATCCLLATT